MQNPAAPLIWSLAKVHFAVSLHDRWHHGGSVCEKRDCMMRQGSKNRWEETVSLFYNNCLLKELTWVP